MRKIFSCFGVCMEETGLDDNRVAIRHGQR